MGNIRKPFQGVWNIIRFNWHFYVLSFGIVTMLLMLSGYTSSLYKPYFLIIALLVFLPTLISLAVSFYIYDLSSLYSFNWTEDIIHTPKSTIININAGFDETSFLLKNKFPDCELVVFDFYNPKKHTEVSIKRARKTYGSFPNTKSVAANNLTLIDNTADIIFVIFAAHEIRNDQERNEFFKELKRVLKPSGEIIIVEHLRDFTNFFAYTVGFLHFYSKQTWLHCFKLTKLSLKSEQKITPFISKFTLTKHGIAS